MNFLTDGERESRLAALAQKQRVWHRGGSEDRTHGLIELCRKWCPIGCCAAEVGCFAGVSTSVIACFAGSVLAVDPWTLATGYSEIPTVMMRDAEQAFKLVCQDYPNITPVRNFSVDAAKDVADASLDFIYIDGAHSREAFVADVAAWEPKVRVGGVIAGHDFGLVAGYFQEAGLPRPKQVYSESSWVVVKG